MMIILMTACSYDEDMETCDVSIKLDYPENSIGPYTGANVDMKDAKSTIFTSKTDATGTAHFNLPVGIYEATTNEQYIDSTGATWWRYIFNGVKSLIVISPDSTNHIEVSLKMSKKRIVH